MRINGRAVLLGAAALYRVAEDARQAPVVPTLELRALVSALAALADSTEPFAAFWLAVVGAGDGMAGPMVATERGNRAMAAWHAIARALQLPADVDTHHLISRASRGDELAINALGRREGSRRPQ